MRAERSNTLPASDKPDTQNLKHMVMQDSDKSKKASKLEMNLNALKFKANIEEEILKNDHSSGARYECIFKNLLRDIRQYYANKFDTFLMQLYGPLAYNKNQKNKYDLFPF